MKRWIIPMLVLLAASGVFAQRAGKIKVVSPNGGEQLAMGAPVDIVWEETGLAGRQIKIQLVKGAGVLADIATVPISTGSYRWKAGSLPGDKWAPIGGGLRIRLQVIGLSVADTSDREFGLTMTAIEGLRPAGKPRAKIEKSKAAPQRRAIQKAVPTPRTRIEKKEQTPRLFVGNPRAGDRWEEGQTRLITWTTNSRGTYSIELYDADGTRKVSDIKTPDVPLNLDGDYQYRWDIPHDATNFTGRYRVKVSMGGTEGMSEPFTLENHLKTQNRIVKLNGQFSTVPHRSFAGGGAKTFENPPPWRKEASPTEIKVGVWNTWDDRDHWIYDLWRGYAFFDLTGLRDQGLLLGAKFRFNPKGPCGQVRPVVSALAEQWNRDDEHFYAVPVYNVDQNNLTQLVTRWMARPYENFGLMVSTSQEASGIPLSNDHACWEFYDDIHLELEFVDSAE